MIESKVERIRRSIAITNTSFVGNRALNGGAVYAANVDLIASDCRFLFNSASVKGGTFYLRGDRNSAQIKRCKFSSEVSGQRNGELLSKVKLVYF